ncbi:glucose-1-phosphate cytidylyltransferase [Yoonia rosea]|uniref:Glucose-1-phosphate cytidylyltransferase n=1 Tax=Yoonia rosea TaxID=287098 RepID=A0A1R3XJF8_9RHOB|nr:NTP transferase domain-containing protein [Yoonia rosea]SIT90404.1 glucose-1-phosphate cytidylyltransferase [Yoonia rosea]
MQTGVILAGGKSERFGGSGALPKPVVLLAGRPMLLHVAASLVRAGCERIIVLTGANHTRMRDALNMTRDIGRFSTDETSDIPFTLRYSGDEAGTGGRLAHVTEDEFGDGALVSYTDVFTDFDLAALRTHRARHAATMSMLAVNPLQPWGELALTGDTVTAFNEKPVALDRWINGGFFSADARLLASIRADSDSLERDVMRRLVAQETVVAQRHTGWWASVNTAKELRQVEDSPYGAFLNRTDPSIV